MKFNKKRQLRFGNHISYKCVISGGVNWLSHILDGNHNMNTGTQKLDFNGLVEALIVSGSCNKFEVHFYGWLSLASSPYTPAECDYQNAFQNPVCDINWNNCLSICIENCLHENEKLQSILAVVLSGTGYFEKEQDYTQNWE